MDNQLYQPPDEPESAGDNSVMDSIVPPVKAQHFLGPIIKLLLVLLIIAALVIGGIWFFARHTSSAKPASKSTTTAKQPSTASSVTKISSSTKHYVSTNYNLGFDYPSDWTITDEASAKLTATSPPLQLRTENDQTFTGQIIFAVQNQQTSITEFAKNTAVAALTSQKLTYEHPTPSQRAQTYLTFVNYSGSLATIDALYITGDNGYQVGQSVPQSDVTQANPLVSVSFVKCADATCRTANTPSPILMKAWNDTGLSKPLVNLLQSLEIE